ncbi:MAG: autoinducer synthase [Rhodobacteraceae bacterium]|nr:autoinducer synthase [Paracoccaceae bacterium]
MIRFIPARELPRHPGLARAMFRDRAVQFRDRLGWPVMVGADGGERDGYDARDPLYVIATDAAGGHAGSLRLMPTTGPTMLSDHFGYLPGATIAGPRVWECTRFCLAPGADARTSARLLLGAAEIGLALGLAHALAVFDAPMERLYGRLGWVPEILGQAGCGTGAIRLGRWAFAPAARDSLARRAGPAAAAAAAAAAAWAAARAALGPAAAAA